MRHCINCCIQLLPNNEYKQHVGCGEGPLRGHPECPACKGENKIVLRVDGKQMNLLAVLEVRAEGNESWGRFLRFKKGKRCSLVFGLMIMTLVMASYILSGAHQELLISSPFHYGAFPSNPSLTDGENPSDTKEHHHQPSVNNISYVKDYASIKLIINSITARIEFTTRQLPDIEDLKKQELHMFSVIPNKFLPNSKSPCWYEEFTGRNTTDPYLTNSYVLYSKRFRSTFDALRKAFWGHLSHASGKHFRLRCLPRFYIIGQPKCGTTDLYDRLRLHPEVKFSAIKEPHWWTRKRFGIVRLRDGLRDRYPVEDYLDLFDLAAHQIHQGLQAGSAQEQSRMTRIIIGEASASTMWDNNAWTFFYDNSTDGEPPFLTQDFIHAFQPDAKLIVMLRDPVERLYSDYLYFASSNKSADDFHEKVTEALQLFENCMLDYSLRACVYNNTLNNAMPVRLQVGLYAVYLLDWLTVFNKEQFLILRLEDHASNVKYTMHRVFQFLNLGPLGEKQETLMTKSPASNTRRPEDRNLGPMWPVTQRILQDFYGPFNTRLAQVLADEAFAWRKT
ncbi:carbohydrate sulfotransferase 15 [Ursus maritimus]|uniref:Sulfotransferase n=1 Tax=Ursus maritimus TaxID=29073 RepID=A0A8M1FB09_URSMA|nr:carbohydrate sulfotransferase 15 [Ursus arctos]XP_040480591.1 carbohydrate sulfotransferase 15 [Ursus maritimus]XP_040480593.1 carbohydrate sulfotransferase 15 [Ursus maritimus]XP_040480594.1 carbohydrate sulfotransferase 15 [Ursus maritimus]XP_040480595.1 carbohydrate sulfotransferase 15 [Ursus maritimus]XP_040480596.1 carbohydrate sulfotransferase 15 [Ursus maritimus]XP_040480597.1 carbohydrate sulfotransferase 15 [Ursus maritimus]XP_040480598.1 carbohydrate sulfotransferase 15 [Ursus m